MKQFQVPQFITIEDKAIGGILTVKQFLFIGGGGGLIVLLHFLLPRLIFFPAAAAIGAFSAALAFLKISERPFTTITKNMIIYLARPRLYIWRQRTAQRKNVAQKPVQKTAVTAIPKLSSSKLSDLSWSLDVKERDREI